MVPSLEHEDHTNDTSVDPFFRHIPRSNRNLRDLPNPMGKLTFEHGDKSVEESHTLLPLHSLWGEECNLPPTSSAYAVVPACLISASVVP